MTITEKQATVEERQKRIYASEVAALLNMDPYKSAADVVATKIHPLQTPLTMSMLLGQLCEPHILAHAKEKFGRHRQNVFFSRPGSHLGAHLDAQLVEKPKNPIEAKTHAILAGKATAHWGDPGTDDVPEYAAIQCHAQMAAMPEPPECCHLGVLLVRSIEPVWYIIPYDTEICEMINERVEEVWHDNIVQRHIPEDSPLSLDIAKRLNRIPELAPEAIPKTLVDVFEAQSEMARNADAGRKAALAAILQHLGEHEAGAIENDTRIFTYQEQPTGGVLSDLLKQNYPKIWAEVKNPKKHRVPRIVKGRS